MAKVTIEFDLSDSNDLRDYNLFNNSEGMFFSIFEIVSNLKKNIRLRYEEHDNETLDIVFNHISGILEDNNIIIDKLK